MGKQPASIGARDGRVRRPSTIERNDRSNAPDLSDQRTFARTGPSRSRRTTRRSSSRNTCSSRTDHWRTWRRSCTAGPARQGCSTSVFEQRRRRRRRKTQRVTRAALPVAVGAAGLAAAARKRAVGEADGVDRRVGDERAGLAAGRPLAERAAARGDRRLAAGRRLTELPRRRAARRRAALRLVGRRPAPTTASAARSQRPNQHNGRANKRRMNAHTQHIRSESDTIHRQIVVVVVCVVVVCLARSPLRTSSQTQRSDTESPRTSCRWPCIRDTWRCSCSCRCRPWPLRTADASVDRCRCCGWGLVDDAVATGRPHRRRVARAPNVDGQWRRRTTAARKSADQSTPSARRLRRASAACAPVFRSRRVSRRSPVHCRQVVEHAVAQHTLLKQTLLAQSRLRLQPAPLLFCATTSSAKHASTTPKAIMFCACDLWRKSQFSSFHPSIVALCVAVPVDLSSRFDSMCAVLSSFDRYRSSIVERPNSGFASN